MKRAIVVAAAILAGALAALPAAADFEITGPDGRRILLKDDRTWQYVEPAAAETGEAAGAQPKPTAQALLYLDEKIEGNRICRYRLRLVNHLPYEIRSIVPEFSAHRASGVVYDAVLAGFSFVKPGNSQRQEVRFNGIACSDVARVRVSGGDRCAMGDLDKFSAGKGECLARVRVIESEVVRFDK